MREKSLPLREPQPASVDGHPGPVVTERADAHLLRRLSAEQDTVAQALASSTARRLREAERLSSSPDGVDRAVAQMYLDMVELARAIERTGESLLLATLESDGSLVGRMAVTNDDREVLLTPWYAPAGQQALGDSRRVLITATPSDGIRLHRLGANPRELVEIVRERMRVSATDARMSDPLATLTPDQAAALSLLDWPGSVVLDGPPGSGKSAILLVELARRMLSAPHGNAPEVLLVTGSSALARRTRALTELLGVASVRPVLHENLFRVLRVADEDMAPVGPDSPDTAGLVAGMRTRLAEVSSRLSSSDPVPHPLGARRPVDVPAVVRARSTAASTSYRRSATSLRAELREDYGAMVGAERASPLVDGVLEQLRPVLRPDDLLRMASKGSARLPLPLRAVARAAASQLLDGSPARRPRFDLVVVDEYQRVPAVALGLLGLRARSMLLSGDPRQGFGSAPEDLDTAHGLAPRRVQLGASLRLPSEISGWIDRFWAEQCLEPPGIATLAQGGTVSEHGSVAEAHRVAGPDAQFIVPGKGADEKIDGARTPFEALGLEWRSVILVDPEGILAEFGEPGLFVAATRAIDCLAVVRRSGA